MRRPTRPRMWQALRAKEDARVYAELQSKQRAAYGDDEAAREAAGKAERMPNTNHTSTRSLVSCLQRGGYPAKITGVIF